jgi:hypothetical protein
MHSRYYKPYEQPNQLKPQFLSVNALNLYPGTVSASRGQMFGSHLSQKLNIFGAECRYQLTGAEMEFGKYTFSIKAPGDMRVLKVIRRYNKTIGQDSIEENPQTVVIYEVDGTNEVGIIDIPRYCSYHQYFGFDYVPQPGAKLLVPNAVIPKDTPLMDAPSIGPNGEYNFGLHLRMAYLSQAPVSEDGILICRDVLPRLRFKTYERRVVEWGSKRFPLNLYGTATYFKAFPDIGDRIREDNVLMMFRTYDPLLAPAEQSIYHLMEPDFGFDEAVYGAGPGGKIIDIQVFHNLGSQVTTPEGMDTQANKYAKANMNFHQEILNEHRRLKSLRRQRGEELNVTPEFHRQAVESLVITDDASQSKIQKLHRGVPLDDYRIEFIIEYEITPDIGFKLTDCYGGKAVICHIAEPHEMPVDADGVRADIVMDANSTISRMNVGRLYEQYFNSASMAILARLRQIAGIPKEEKHIKARVIELAENQPLIFDQAYDYLLGYYKIVSPIQYNWMANEATPEQKANHLGEVLKDFIYLYLPTDNEPELVRMVQETQKYCTPTYGPVTFIGFSGRQTTTFESVRIAPVYMMLLEKIGNDWSAVSSGRVHHFGFLTSVNRSDKHTQPLRSQPVRAIGESEARIFVSYCDQRAMAELMDRNCSPQSHKEICKSILTAEHPTNIAVAIDRKKFPLGGSKPIQLVNHIGYCAGWTFVYKKNM